MGMWKAFEEMEQLGWIGTKRPRMVAVQAAGCAPLVKAFQENRASAEPWHGASTVAAGLRVPRILGDFLLLDILRKSCGTALTVTDQEMMEAVKVIGQAEGLFAAPEGAATFAALKKLLAWGFVTPEQEVVLFNTASGLKYLHLFSRVIT